MAKSKTPTQVKTEFLEKQFQEKAERKELRRKKAFYYLDEFSIFLFSVAAVIFADAIDQRIKGRNASAEVILLDWLNVLISIFLAIITYGAVHTQFKYSDEDKAPYFKRASTALLQGIAWRSIVGWAG
jgi:hypothetical protein